MSIFNKSYKAEDDDSELQFSANSGNIIIYIQIDKFARSDEISFEIPIDEIENLKEDYYN